MSETQPPSEDHEPGRRILMVASNPATSPLTGWPIGFWWAELTHPYWEFTEAGYEVTIASPDGGPIRADTYSDPDDSSGYSERDLLSLGFKNSSRHAALLAETPALSDVRLDDHDAIFLVGGQGPMFTFAENHTVRSLVAEAYEAGMPTAVVCHATCVLLEARKQDGDLVVSGRTWTGFANSEEDYADSAAGRRLQPFRIEQRAKALPGTNFIVGPRFASFAVRDGNLITGQQQHSGTAAARLVIEALGR